MFNIEVAVNRTNSMQVKLQLNHWEMIRKKVSIYFWECTMGEYNSVRRTSSANATWFMFNK